MPAPIALQLYSVRDAIAEQGLASVLHAVAEMGYLGVESYGGLDATAVAQHAADLDLKLPSAHLSIPLGDDQAAVLETAKTLGVSTIVVPWLNPDPHFASADGVQETIELLNAAHAVCAEHGYRLGYHNHDFEFNDIDGTPAYELLQAGLHEDIILELDTYWAKVGGHDPAQVVRSLGARGPLLHIKDGPATDTAAPMVAVGAGAMDIPAVIAAGDGQSEWLIVELDRCATDMLTAVRESYQYLISNELAAGRN